MPDLRRYKCGFLEPAKAAAINSSGATLARFVAGLPKAELHVHIEGTLEPEGMLAAAQRNGLLASLPGYGGGGGGGDDGAAWCAAQRARRLRFGGLQDFLDLYYAGCDVLRTELDFYELGMAYLRKAAACGVRRAEIFFDPQTHTVERNQLPLAVVVGGLHRACAEAKASLTLPSLSTVC